MKLRIRGNSIRIRLQITEIEQLSKNGRVTETIDFAPDQTLTYSIISNNDAGTISASFTSNEVSVNIPGPIAKDWCDSEEVSLETSQVIDEGTRLKILLEKDFKCLTRRDDETDMFPNPKKAH